MSANDSKLMPEKHPNLDFFVADILDANPKDDMGSMEHPMFALRAGDKNIRTYEHNGNSIEITPSVKGLATIFDKDILIYCVSQLIDAQNRGRETSKTVRITAYDLLVATNRDTGGKGYKALQETFDRLNGTVIKTNIKTDKVRIKRGFGLIDSYEIVEKSENDKRMIAVEITLSDWLYNSVKANEVLAISRDYFRLRKPLERRLYEIARKHCGKQPNWKISLDLLHKKTGSNAALREFRRLIKEIETHQHLPGYDVSFNIDLDLVIFNNQKACG